MARVIKTLVIGLGSTGTRICDALADRIRWELQDLSRAPWVEFLSIETDENQQSQLHETGDFRILRIEAADYELILQELAPDDEPIAGAGRRPGVERSTVQDMSAYDESIQLNKWADGETLRNLPGGEVGAGAGNIRMVGRLAFLYEENYNAVKEAVQTRLDRLRQRTAADAFQLRGVLADGSNPPLTFAAGGTVRVVVVGTLCGGTCSGLAGDFGHFLKTICREDEKVVAIFTLPRPDLTAAIQPRADRFKRNAYAALVELNHYHLTGQVAAPVIHYADGVEANMGRFPYDLPYLAMPRGVGPASETELTGAIADRLFLNVFVPETDPFAAAVDATYADLEHRAHVFCSFGLSTVEFPAQRVMEACSKRLLAYALREWQGRALNTAEERSRLDQIGLTWPAMLESLRQMDGGSSISQRLSQKRDEIVRMAITSLDQAEKSLQELRDAFSASSAGTGPGPLPPGIVPKTFKGNRSAAADAVVDKLRDHTRTYLLQYYEGPAPLRQLLQRAQEKIVELKAGRAFTHTAEEESVDALFKPLRSYHQSRLLGLLRLKRPAIKKVLPKLSQALNSEIQARENAEAYRALQPRTERGDVDPGTLERVSRLIRPVQTRVDHLCERTVALVNRLTIRADELARTAPEINGESIFDPETASEGTVRAEYKECLFKAGDTVQTWEEVRSQVAAQIVASWNELPNAVVPQSTSGIDDWLLPDFDPNRPGQSFIPKGDLRTLETAARAPFLRLAQVDVLERWQRLDDATQKARAAVQKAKPFLGVNRTLAQQGGRSPIPSRRIALAPSSAHNAEFVRSATAGTGNVAQATSPDRFRAIFLEEWYRFPLSGAPEILGARGIHRAECNDFPTFHTRVDTYWTGLSDKEVEALKEAEELVTVGILLEVLEPRGGAVMLEWKAGGFGDPGDRRLPLDVRGAAQFLAQEGKDLGRRSSDGRLRKYSLAGARELVSQRIDQIRQQSGSQQPGVNQSQHQQVDGQQGSGQQPSRDKVFIQRLAAQLKDGVGNVVPGWDSQVAAEHLTRYCARHPELFQAYVEVFPPDAAIIAKLKRHTGDQRPMGGQFDRDGLYCPHDGGLIGYDVQDAARNGWRCYIEPSHYFGVGSSE